MRNLAGIVPVAGYATDINLPWHHVMMPFDKNKVLIENSVYTCAMAGCKSIWIICNDDIQPLIKSIVGDQVQDPVYRFRSFAKFASDHKKTIPIFYVPMPIRDIQRRNNIAWTAIYGCLLSNKIFGQLSTYTAPDQFFISWPYAVLDSTPFRKCRTDIQKKSMLFDCGGKNIFTGDFLPVVCNIEEVKKIKEYCYELQNPYGSNQTLSELDPHELLEPMRKTEIVGVDCNYVKVASWTDYCSLLKI